MCFSAQHTANPVEGFLSLRLRSLWFAALLGLLMPWCAGQDQTPQNPHPENQTQQNQAPQNQAPQSPTPQGQSSSRDQSSPQGESSSRDQSSSQDQPAKTQ